MKTNIPQPLADLRDELAEAKHKEGKTGVAFGIIEGFNAAITVLSEQAGELTLKEPSYDLTVNELSAFQDGQEFQFEQSAARVGRAKLFEQQCLETVEHNNKAWEARLAESEACTERMKEALKYCMQNKDKAIDKLAALSKVLGE